MSTLDPDAIRRMLDAGDPVPPWVVRQLCDQMERSLWCCRCGWAGNTPDIHEAHAAAYEPNRQLPAPLCPTCGRYFAAHEFPMIRRHT